ncbi:unnamed protein product [Arctogadus glacialis]
MVANHRNFGSNNSTDAFTMTGYNNWHHALVCGKGLGRHESSKEHMKSVALWKERRARSVTVAAEYTGEKLKRLLEQRWTGHLATVTVILKSIDNIVHLLRGIESTQTSAAEVRMEATGLLKAITQPSFLVIACMTHQILSLLDPPNTALQAKSTDLYTGVRLVQSALACVEKLRCDTQFDTFWRNSLKTDRPQNLLQHPHRNNQEI